MTQGHRAPVSKSGQGSICRCAASGSRECFPCEGERQVCRRPGLEQPPAGSFARDPGGCY